MERLLFKRLDLNSEELNKYWTNRYIEGHTGWDISYPSTPLKEYFDQIENKEIKILIPGAGNAYEAEYLHNLGFKNVYVLDISEFPLQTLKQRVPSFPEDHIILGNFFTHSAKYDLIIEQTFFCSFEPTKENRSQYAAKMAELLNQKGRLVGLWFKRPFADETKPPFGGNKEEYLSYLETHFTVHTFEDCYNSIRPRAGNELFGIFVKQ